MRLGFICAGVVLGLLASTDARAARFANQFLEFELPAGWDCSLEGAEWICQSKDESKRRDAIIVLAAKLKGDQDSLDQYMGYLNAPKAYMSVQGKPMKSDPKYAKNLADQQKHVWVDSLHEASEIPGFMTRYLATVKTDIGVLLTYSIRKDRWAQYAGEFDSLLKTLKVFRKAGGINSSGNGSIFAQAGIPAGVSAGTIFPAVAPAGGSDDAKPRKPAGQEDDMMLYILVGGAVVAFFVMKKRRSA